MNTATVHIDFGGVPLVDPRAFCRLYRRRFRLPLWLACKLSDMVAQIRYNPYRS